MSGYIGAQPVPQATQHREAFTATASQTSFPTVGYTPQFVDVYLNGVKLAAADYTATNGSDIVLTTGAALNDILEYVAYTPFEVASQTFTGTTTVDALVATGNVGIDTSAPSAKLDVSGSANGVLRLKHNYSYSQPNWAIKIDGEVGTPAGYLSQSGASGGFFLASGGVYYGGGNYKADANATSFCSIQAASDTITFSNASGLTGGQVFSGTERMRIDANGALLHGTTTAGSAGAGDIVVNGGVYLGGTAAANKLDSYEQGTWTPTVVSGTIVTSSACTYTKIGRLVHLTGANLIFSDYTSTATLQIENLPFTPSTGSMTGSVMMQYRDDTLALTSFIPASTAAVKFYLNSSTSTYAPARHNMFNNASGNIYFSIVYLTDA